MVIDYKTLEDDSAEGIDKKVNEYIEQGWQPQGGISKSAMMWDGVICEFYAQAMVLIARRSVVVKDTREGLSVSGG